MKGASGREVVVVKAKSERKIFTADKPRGTLLVYLYILCEHVLAKCVS